MFFAPSFVAKKPLQDMGSSNVQIANCAGWTTTGNCSANSLWNMPDANWWSFPFATTYGNPSGYTFGTGYGDMPNCGGGSSTSNTALTTTNSRINSGSPVVAVLGVHQRTTQDQQNCNCGPTGTAAQGNCYSNCNCSTACNCNCACRC